MNIIVTGGNGYLGSNIVRKFLIENHSICVFSRNTSNIEDILSKIKFYKAENNTLCSFKDQIKEFEPDLVIHCGWSGGNSYNDINNISQFHDNVKPSIELIELLSTLPKVPKFIGFGSFAEYGILSSPSTEIIQENPINLYGLSKYTLKKYSKILCEQHNMEWIWIRPCYVYGPGDVKTRLIPTLINKFLHNQEVVLDECNTIIDYIYIDDFVDLLYKLTLTKNTGVYNICSGNQYNLKEIINQIYNLVDSKSSIIFDSKLNRTSVSTYTCGDNTKIKKDTELVPQIDLKEGLLRTINFYKK